MLVKSMLWNNDNAYENRNCFTPKAHFEAVQFALKSLLEQATNLKKEIVMNENRQINVSSELSLGIILFIIFLILKLTHTIDWSWWWITSPIWIECACLIPFILLVLTIITFGH